MIPPDPSRNPTPMACAVCGLVLARYHKEGKAQFKHGPGDPDDHPVIVVPAAQIHATIRCDFCLAEDATWTLPVETYAMQGGPDMNIGDWAVCDICAGLLQDDAWDLIVQRVWLLFVERNGMVPKSAFERMYEELRPHILGPVYRVN